MINTASRAKVSRKTTKRRLLRTAIGLAVATTAAIVATPSTHVYDGPSLKMPPLPINATNSVRTNPFCESDSAAGGPVIALASGAQTSTMRLRKVGNAIGLAPISTMTNQSAGRRQGEAIQIDVPRSTPIRKNPLLGSKHHTNFDLVPAAAASPEGNGLAFRKLNSQIRMPATPKSLVDTPDSFNAVQNPRPQFTPPQHTEMVLIPRPTPQPKPVVAEKLPAIQPVTIPAAAAVDASVVPIAEVAEVLLPQPADAIEQQVSFTFSLSDDSESSPAVIASPAGVAQIAELDLGTRLPTGNENFGDLPDADNTADKSADDLAINSAPSAGSVRQSEQAAERASRQRVKRRLEIDERPSFVAAAAPIVAFAEPDVLSLADSGEVADSETRVILPIELQDADEADEADDAGQPRLLKVDRPVLLVQPGPQGDERPDVTEALAGLMPPSIGRMSPDEKAKEYRPPVEVARAPVGTSNPSPADDLVGLPSQLTAVEMPVFDAQVVAPEPVEAVVQPVSFDQRMEEIAAEYGIKPSTAAATPLYMSRAQVKSLKIDGDLYRINVADGKVCNAISVNSNEIKIIGAGNGVTRLAVWAAPLGKTKIQARVFEIHVTDAGESASKPVDDHLSALTRTVRHAFPYAEVEFRQTGGQLVVSGFCSNADSATQIIRMVRKTYLLPVIDELTVR